MLKRPNATLTDHNTKTVWEGTEDQGTEDQASAAKLVDQFQNLERMYEDWTEDMDGSKSALSVKNGRKRRRSSVFERSQVEESKPARKTLEKEDSQDFVTPSLGDGYDSPNEYGDPSTRPFVYVLSRQRSKKRSRRTESSEKPNRKRHQTAMTGDDQKEEGFAAPTVRPNLPQQRVKTAAHRDPRGAMQKGRRHQVVPHPEVATENSGGGGGGLVVAPLQRHRGNATAMKTDAVAAPPLPCKTPYIASRKVRVGKPGATPWPGLVLGPNQKVYGRTVRRPKGVRRRASLPAMSSSGQHRHRRPVRTSDQILQAFGELTTTTVTTIPRSRDPRSERNSTLIPRHQSHDPRGAVDQQAAHPGGGQMAVDRGLPTPEAKQRTLGHSLSVPITRVTPVAEYRRRRDKAQSSPWTPGENAASSTTRLGHQRKARVHPLTAVSEDSDAWKYDCPQSQDPQQTQEEPPAKKRRVLDISSDHHVIDKPVQPGAPQTPALALTVTKALSYNLPSSGESILTDGETIVTPRKTPGEFLEDNEKEKFGCRVM